MILERKIAEACNISLEDAHNELHYQQTQLHSLLADGCLDYEDVMDACASLGLELEFDTLTALIGY